MTDRPDFDPNWPHGHITRDGRPARIICTDRRATASFMSMVALVTEPNGVEIAKMYRPDGLRRQGEYGPCTLDLVNAPEPAPRVSGWIIVTGHEHIPGLFGTTGGFVFSTREDAALAAKPYQRIIYVDAEAEKPHA